MMQQKKIKLEINFLLLLILILDPVEIRKVINRERERKKR